jgi:hypothetical protein
MPLHDLNIRNTQVILRHSITIPTTYLNFKKSATNICRVQLVSMKAVANYRQAHIYFTNKLNLKVLWHGMLARYLLKMVQIHRKMSAK